MRRLALAVALGALAGCMVPRAARLPSLASPNVTMDRDERLLRRGAAEMDESARKSGAVRAEPALEQYLLAVARRLTPKAALQHLDLRVRVIDTPSLAAFAVPDGGIYLSVGLLARLETEAQLAVVLAHEITHAVNRHSVVTYRTYKRGAAMAVSGFPFALGEAGTLAAVSGYSRDLEAEADEEGLALVAAAGLDVSQAKRPFEHLAAWVKEENLKEPFVYATHPRLQDRIRSYDKLLSGRYAGRKGDGGADRYRAATAHLLVAAARLDLAAGRFRAAERSARAFIDLVPRPADGWTIIGDIARQSRPKDGEELALGFYRKAVELDDSCADAQRELGFSLSRKGQRDGARMALERYLRLRPAAVDRRWVEGELKNLTGGNR
jgi:predicted Zn-dependent protease